MYYTIEIKLNNKVQTTKTLNKTNKILNKKYFKVKKQFFHRKEIEIH